MSHYDRIARRWDAVTGDRGGAFKRHVLNDLLLQRLGELRGLDVLELGAGNGYFAALLKGRPRRLAVTDASEELLRVAQERRPAPGAEYLRLDVGDPFPFAAGEFDVVLAVMLFNELRTSALANALRECARVLRPQGRLLAALLHPRFVHSLDRRGQLRGHPLTMPGGKGLRLPVARRDRENYEALLTAANFEFEAEDVAPTAKVLEEKRGAAAAGKLPWALLVDARPRALS